MATIVHDVSEAVELCAAQGLYLKPVARMSISVALPALKPPGKSISNWEVMERLKAMQQPPFSALRVAKSTLDFVRFEGELEHRGLVQAALARLDGQTIKLSGFADSLRVRAAEFRLDFPSRHDWDSFFRDAQDMNEALPGERPDTIHLEGLPCRWFAPRDRTTASSTAAGGSCGTGSVTHGPGFGVTAGSVNPERPSEQVLARVFGKFGAIRHVDIPMLDPYREEMAGRGFHTFSLGGPLHFEAYVQYREYDGFLQAMSALRGMKLMFKGDDGKAVACNIKVSFDSTKHLSDASIRKRQLERQKLQELERQREEQKRREKEAEERQRAEEKKQREQEEQERARRRGERARRREQRARARAQRRSQKRQEKLQVQEQRRLQEKVRLEERKLLLAQRNLQSLRLVAELLSRAKTARLREQERLEQLQRQEQRQRRRVQEAELRRVEEEKRRALGLQRRERELRSRLLSLLLRKRGPDGPNGPDGPTCGPSDPDLLLRPVLDLLQQTARGRTQGATGQGGDGILAATTTGMHGGPGVLTCIPPNATPAEPRRDPRECEAMRQEVRDQDRDADKCNRLPEGKASDTRARDREHRTRAHPRSVSPDHDHTRSRRRSPSADLGQASRRHHECRRSRHRREREHRGHRDRDRSRSGSRGRHLSSRDR